VADTEYPTPRPEPHKRLLEINSAVHEQAVLVHERAAAFFDRYHKDDLAARERAKAERQLELAREAKHQVGMAPDLLQWPEPGHEALRQARLARARSRPHRRSFWLEGFIHGEPVFAAVRDGKVIAHDLLLQRARLVVALGDSFVRPDGPPIPATLDGPAVGVLLTLIRACDRANVITMGPLWPPAESTRDGAHRLYL
jgi:hypothetical protein